MVNFTYDGEGLITLYFILTIAAFVLIPVTYLFWPRTKNEEDERLERLRAVHVRSKWFHKKVQERRKRYSPLFIRSVLMALWAVFLFYCFKASQIEVVKPNWSPYDVLEVSETATKKRN